MAKPNKTTPVQQTPVATPEVAELIDAGTTESEVVVAETPVVEESPVVEAPVVEEAPKVVDIVVAKEELSEFEKQLATLLNKGDSKVIYVISTLKTYIKEMAPGVQMNFKDGAQRQYGLWKLVSLIAESYEAADFKTAWGILLGFFNEHAKGVFGPRYAFRFSEDWSYNPDELEALQRILDLCMLTAQPSSRKSVLSQINFTKVLSKGFSESARNKIVSFYR